MLLTPVKPAKKLLGFDARIKIEAQRRHVGAIKSARSALFLNPRLECPLSVDQNIWPTVFDYFPHVNKALGTPSEKGLIQLDNHRDGLWESLFDMKDRLKAERCQSVIIGIEVLGASHLAPHEFGSNLIIAEPSPAKVPLDGVLLGFDVATAGFLSGLCNCGYAVDERDEMRSKWASRLNGSGLFRSIEDALEYRELTDQRVPGHAPFYVYALQQIGG